MDYRKKYIKLDKELKNNKSDKKDIVNEKDGKEKIDNSYLQKLLQNNDKKPKTVPINLMSYKENIIN